MGIFFKSESDRIKEQIVDEINKINHKLKQLESILNKGLCYSNEDQLDNLLDDLYSSLKIFRSKIASLSPKQLGKLALPWIDGTYIPVYLWEISFKYVMAKITNEFQQHIDSKAH